MVIESIPPDLFCVILHKLRIPNGTSVSSIYWCIKESNEIFSIQIQSLLDLQVNNRTVYFVKPSKSKIEPELIVSLSNRTHFFAKYPCKSISRGAPFKPLSLTLKSLQTQNTIIATLETACQVRWLPSPSHTNINFTGYKDNSVTGVYFLPGRSKDAQKIAFDKAIAEATKFRIASKGKFLDYVDPLYQKDKDKVNDGYRAVREGQNSTEIDTKNYLQGIKLNFSDGDVEYIKLKSDIAERADANITKRYEPEFLNWAAPTARDCTCLFKLYPTNPYSCYPEDVKVECKSDFAEVKRVNKSFESKFRSDTERRRPISTRNLNSDMFENTTRIDKDFVTDGNTGRVGEIDYDELYYDMYLAQKFQELVESSESESDDASVDTEQDASSDISNAIYFSQIDKGVQVDSPKTIKDDSDENVAISKEHVDSFDMNKTAFVEPTVPADDKCEDPEKPKHFFSRFIDIITSNTIGRLTSSSSNESKGSVYEDFIGTQVVEKRAPMSNNDRYLITDEMSPVVSDFIAQTDRNAEISISSQSEIFIAEEESIVPIQAEQSEFPSHRSANDEVIIIEDIEQSSVIDNLQQVPLEESLEEADGGGEIEIIPTREEIIKLEEPITKTSDDILNLIAYSEEDGFDSTGIYNRYSSSKYGTHISFKFSFDDMSDLYCFSDNDEGFSPFTSRANSATLDGQQQQQVATGITTCYSDEETGLDQMTVKGSDDIDCGISPAPDLSPVVADEAVTGKDVIDDEAVTGKAVTDEAVFDQAPNAMPSGESIANASHTGSGGSVGSDACNGTMHKGTTFVQYDTHCG